MKTIRAVLEALLTIALLAGCSDAQQSAGRHNPSSSQGGALSSGGGGSAGTVGGSAGTANGASSGGGSLAIGGSSSGGSNDGGAAGAGGSAEQSDIVGKISVGYQGWFTADGDGSGIQPPWWHWSPDRQLPSAANNGIKSWPDMTDVTSGYTTGFANLGNGSAARLFSSYDAATVDTHVLWMKDAGIDTLALQRFGDYRGTGEQRNVVAWHVRDACQAHDRKFYIMYDISGWTSFASDIPSDWDTHIEGELGLVSSPAYATQDGKPVVCIWGMGFLDRPGDVTTSLATIDFFKDKGFYVIGGVPNDWRSATGTRWSKTGYQDVYADFDAISPWMVGVIGDDAGSDNDRAAFKNDDASDLHARQKHFQPCVLPGDLQEGQRKHGDFMWHQFANMIELGADALYISMFDEYNEGNQIAKTAATQAAVPSDSAIKSLDEDGTACSADYYLRLTADGGKMLRGEIPLVWTRPTPTSN